MEKQLEKNPADITESRNNNFNAIRFIAAIMVIFGHMYPLLGLQPGLLMGQAVSTIAVKIFFLISGYLITESYMRDTNILRYTLRRFFRIIPGLAAVVLLTALVIGPLVSTLSVRQYFSSSGIWAYLKNIALYMNYSLPGVFENNIYPNAVNGSLWSLPIEVAMYILLPCFMFLGKKLFKNIRATIIVAVIISISATAIKRLIFADTLVVFYGTNIGDGLVLAPYFFIGALFTFPQIKQRLNLQVAAGLWLVTSFLWLSDFKIEFILYGVLSYSVFSAALATNPAYGKWFSKNDYSYGIYLYGFLVQQLMVHFLNGMSVSYNVYVLISVVITFVFAFVSWHLFEKPAQRFGKWILNTDCIKRLKGKANGQEYINTQKHYPVSE